MLIGDWLFVNKLAYGPHVPFTNINLPGYAEPKRYEISVFVSPPQHDQPWDLTPTLVKRGPGPRTWLLGNLDRPELLVDLLEVNGVERRRD